LLNRVAQGDRAAFTRCYERTSAQVMGLVLRLLPDPGLAEAVLQDIYLAVWRQAGSYESAHMPPMIWLMALARQRSHEALRRRDPALLVQMLAGRTSRHGRDELAADTSPPPELLGAAMLARAVRGCLHSITTEQQQSLALAYYHGLSHTEVAEHLHQSPEAVKSWLRSGLLTLRACLERRTDGL
jgi:RNA polymerase sigma-70 factor (ECF subfamily)